MATVQTLVNRSLRLIGVIGSGESPSTDESNDSLTALNAMLDSWRNDKLMVYAQTNITIPLVANTASYTIGASGATVTATAPVKAESAYIRNSGTDYPLKQLTDAEYQAKQSKAVTSDIPAEFMFTHTYPNATVTLYPVPSAVNNLYLRVWTPFSALALTDTFALPPGYEDAIVYNLAIRLYPEFPAIQLNRIVQQTAKESLASVKRINAIPHIQTSQLAKMFTANRERVDITAGE